MTVDRLEIFVCCLYAEGGYRRIHSRIQGVAPWFGTEGSEVQILSPDQFSFANRQTQFAWSLGFDRVTAASNRERPRLSAQKRSRFLPLPIAEGDVG